MILSGLELLVLDTGLVMLTVVHCSTTACQQTLEAYPMACVSVHV